MLEGICQTIQVILCILEELEEGEVLPMSKINTLSIEDIFDSMQVNTAATTVRPFNKGLTNVVSPMRKKFDSNSSARWQNRF